MDFSTVCSRAGSSDLCPNLNLEVNVCVFMSLNYRVKQKVKLSLELAAKTHRSVRRRGSRIFLDSRPMDGNEVFSPERSSGTLFC
jgi:hypothetical protein